jgi:hypothetical protein
MGVHIPRTTLVSVVGLRRTDRRYPVSAPLRKADIVGILFNDCIMFHLLTAFPINVAEQEKCYISNVLKKPQRINVRQFIRHVEKLNAYIAQMPCF